MASQRPLVPLSPPPPTEGQAGACAPPLVTPPHSHERAHFGGAHSRDMREVPPVIEGIYDSAVRRLPPKFGGAAGERSRAREAWSRMIEEEEGLDGRGAASDDDGDAEVASLVGVYAGRGRAAVSELQLSSLSAKFADLSQRPSACLAAAARPPLDAAAADRPVLHGESVPAEAPATTEAEPGMEMHQRTGGHAAEDFDNLTHPAFLRTCDSCGIACSGKCAESARSSYRSAVSSVLGSFSSQSSVRSWSSPRTHSGAPAAAPVFDDGSVANAPRKALEAPPPRPHSLPLAAAGRHSPTGADAETAR